MKKIIFFSCLFILFSACQKIVLGEDEVNSPENNFELFWTDFDQYYGLFVARGWNWDSIYNEYRPQVSAQTTEEELWTICEDMISYLDDSHTYLYHPIKREYFASGSENEEQVLSELSIDLLREKYIENIETVPEEDPEDGYFFGKVKSKDIGYIYLSGIDLDRPSAIDDVLRKIGSHKAIVFDIRSNTGGDDYVADAIAGRFADSEHLVYTYEERNGAAHSDFTEKEERFTTIVGDEHFDKPVILLTDQNTVSAGEIFTLQMKSFANITQLGDNTAGDLSLVSLQRFLPNGWTYGFSIMQVLLPNGESIDGIGVTPDVYVRNTVDDIANDTDVVFEYATQYLFDEYGIE